MSSCVEKCSRCNVRSVRSLTHSRIPITQRITLTLSNTNRCKIQKHVRRYFKQPSTVWWRWTTNTNSRQRNPQFQAHSGADNNALEKAYQTLWSSSENKTIDVVIGSSKDKIAVRLCVWHFDTLLIFSNTLDHYEITHLALRARMNRYESKEADDSDRSFNSDRTSSNSAIESRREETFDRFEPVRWEFKVSFEVILQEYIVRNLCNRFVMFRNGIEIWNSRAST